MLVTYTGPSPARSLGDVAGRVERGKPVEVPDAIGERLVLMDDWKAAEEAPKPRKTKATTESEGGDE